MDAREKKRMLSSQTHQLIYSHVAVSTSIGLVGESKVKPRLGHFDRLADTLHPGSAQQFSAIFVHPGHF